MREQTTLESFAPDCYQVNLPSLEMPEKESSSGFKLLRFRWFCSYDSYNSDGAKGGGGGKVTAALLLNINTYIKVLKRTRYSNM